MVFEHSGDKMNSLEEIKAHIHSLNRQTGDLFSKTSLDFAPSLQKSQLMEWASLCDAIAASGWHGWEPAREYISISKSLYDLEGFDYLLDRGRYGLSLCQYSFEPASAYFSAIKPMTARNHLHFLGPIEEAGTYLRSNYQQASNLLTACLRMGFVTAEDEEFKCLSIWRDIVMRYADDGRQKLEKFFVAGKGQKALPWITLKAVSQISLSNLTDLLNRFESLRDRLDIHSLQSVEPLFIDYASAENETFTAWLDALEEILTTCPQSLRRKLIMYMLQLPDADLAVRLLKQASVLPLDKEEVLANWIEEGVKTAENNRLAGEAYFDLQSASSRLRLQALEGRVIFSDCHRLFQLFSEALSGFKLGIEVLPNREVDDQSRTSVNAPVNSPLALAFTDTHRVYLPESSSLFGSRKENFFAYKMTLLHQLGFYEFGTFKLNKHSPFGSYQSFFSTFPNQDLAQAIFNILEDGRIDWMLHKKYKGIRADLDELMRATLKIRDEARDETGILKNTTGKNLPIKEKPLDQLLEGMIRYSLKGKAEEVVEDACQADLNKLLGLFKQLRFANSVEDTLDVTRQCYEVLAIYSLEKDAAETEVIDPCAVDKKVTEDAGFSSATDLYDRIPFRGRLDIYNLSLRLQLEHIEESINELLNEEESISLTSLVDPSKVRIEQLKKGEVSEAMGMFLTDLESMIADEEVDEDELSAAKGQMEELLEMKLKTKLEGDVFYYDEWDCLINDYRSDWCTLYELRNLEENESYVSETLKQHGDLAVQVRRQLQMLKPEMLRKVKAMSEGEDLDLEKVIEAVIDKKSGRSPDDNLYIQRTRKERDVSTLFLLDMSASTDDLISSLSNSSDTIEDNSIEDYSVEEKARDGVVGDTEDILDTYYETMNAEDESGKRIIDIEKEAAVLMAEALDELGDNYSICGFSGYGKDRVDYYICKDFDEKYGYSVKGKIGAIKPCRSTRMGPAIRHAVRSLNATESRIKALIIISDGYPQDYDYGHDRNDRDYGVQDTTRALSEARQKGVQTFCLTVDPSGHDYLREMCPDKQYMVIQDIHQLPHELSKVYRALTG